jgi:hypothetical protein
MRKRLFGFVGMIAVMVAALTISHRAYIWIEPKTASAQSAIRPWTAIGASGSVDEASLPMFGFSSASAGYNSTSSSVSPLEFRYNITNTYDNNANPNMPGWTKLELGAQATENSFVEARLYRISRCTGAWLQICPTVRVQNATTGTCLTCEMNQPIDFGTYLYAVDVTVDRAVNTERPMVHTLRIY